MKYSLQTETKSVINLFVSFRVWVNEFSFCMRNRNGLFIWFSFSIKWDWSVRFFSCMCELRNRLQWWLNSCIICDKTRIALGSSLSQDDEDIDVPMRACECVCITKISSPVLCVRVSLSTDSEGVFESIN